MVIDYLYIKVIYIKHNLLILLNLKINYLFNYLKLPFKGNFKFLYLQWFVVCLFIQLPKLPFSEAPPSSKF